MFAMLADKQGRCMRFIEVLPDGTRYVMVNVMGLSNMADKIGTITIEIGNKRTVVPIVQPEDMAARPT